MNINSTAAAQLKDMTPDEALSRLKQGNVRFLNNLQHPRDHHGDLDRTKEAQWPFAAIVACMDSRVSTETVFDLGIGDMFSLRMAGNVITDGIIGSLEFAAGVVGSRLIVVMGHSNCGAVKAACDQVELGHLTTLLEQVQPAVQLASAGRGPRTSKNSEFVQQAAEMNARLGAVQLAQRSPLLQNLVQEGAVKIVPAMYEVATGQVRFLELLPAKSGSSPRPGRLVGAL